jgi:hypothetical protein
MVSLVTSSRKGNRKRKAKGMCHENNNNWHKSINLHGRGGVTGTPVNKMSFRIMHLPRSAKIAFFMAYDVSAACLALWLALMLRLGFSSPYEFGGTEVAISAVIMLITAASFYGLGLYKSIVRFMGHQAIIAIIKGVSISTLSLAFLVFMTQTFMPRSTPLIYWCLMIIFVGAPRFFIRVSYYRFCGAAVAYCAAPR